MRYLGWMALVATAVAAPLFRMTVYWCLSVRRGEPYGVGDVLELVIIVASVLALFAVALVSALRRKWPVAGVSAGLALFVVVTQPVWSNWRLDSGIRRLCRCCPENGQRLWCRPC